jgi:hypothetical protein
MDDAPQLSGTDRESAIARDDKLELRVWLRLLTCSNLIESRVRAGLRGTSRSRFPASTCLRSSTARRTG